MLYVYVNINFYKNQYCVFSQIKTPICFSLFFHPLSSPLLVVALAKPLRRSLCCCCCHRLSLLTPLPIVIASQCRYSSTSMFWPNPLEPSTFIHATIGFRLLDSLSLNNNYALKNVEQLALIFVTGLLNPIPQMYHIESSLKFYWSNLEVHFFLLC